MSGRLAAPAAAPAFAGVQDRAHGAALSRAARIRQGIVAGINADFPGLSAQIEQDDVVIEGHDLLVRWLRDAALRDIGPSVARGELS